MDYLGRRICWEKEGIVLEADPKHVEALLAEAEMAGCKAVCSPGVANSREHEGQAGSAGAEAVLEGQEATHYRRQVARMNYLAQDRIDLSFAVKEVARTMDSPPVSDQLQLKRILRYLQGARRGGYMFRWQRPVSLLVCQVDSDWAGSTRTRRSTSGGVLLRGGHCLAHWSRTQVTVALSSGEAEPNAALKGAAELLGANELMREHNAPMGLRLEGDSVACQGIVSREGCGRIKHLEVRQLWIQSKIREGQISFTKIPREQNSADSQTKHWSSDSWNNFHAAGFRILSTHTQLCLEPVVTDHQPTTPSPMNSKSNCTIL